nr:EOG090X01LQ [Eurycercus lamellatus]
MNNFATILVQEPGPSQNGTQEAVAIDQIVSEAVKRVLKDSGHLLEGFDASKIMELVGQQKLVEKVVQGLAPEIKKPDSNKSAKGHHKTYTIPVGTPAYTPTPLAVLKKTKPVKVENYVPADSSNKSTTTYKPSRVTAKPDTYTPSGLSTAPDVNYTPSSRDSDNIINDRYTPPSSSDCDLADYQPTSKEFNSMEPSYSPSCSTTVQGVDYSPSCITMLTAEPTYSPAQSHSTAEVVVADYTPSSLSPEKYLELFENGSSGNTEASSPEKKAAKTESSSSSSRKRSKEDEEKRRKEKERLRRKEKEKEKSTSSSSSSSSKTKHSSSKKSSSSSSSSSSKKSKYSETKSSSSSSKNGKSKIEEDPGSDSDVDEECYRIFQEYQPSACQPDDGKKKRKSDEPPSTAMEAPVIPVKKQRVAHVSSESMPSRPSTLAPAKPPPRLSPGMMMIDRFKKLQEARQAAVAASTAASAPSQAPVRASPFPVTSSGSEKKRIAHVPNVSSLLSSKPIKSSTNQPSAFPATTSATSQQQQQRTLTNGAAKPALQKAVAPATTLPRPVIAVEFGCRVPANVRQKYLNVLVDETLKIYDREEDAYTRAVEEERAAYSKCSSKVVYVNVITNLVQRIRREAETGSSKAGTSQGERKTMSHSAMLAGKGGASVSWSIEKPRNGHQFDTNLLKGAALYKLLERHVLTLEQQDFNGYPRPDPIEKGKAIVNSVNKFRPKTSTASLNLGADQRICDRCSKIYRVNSKGLAIKQDDICSYHWGKPFTRRGDTRYTCCKGEANSDGCSIAKFHITDTINADNLKGGFVRTMTKPAPADGNYGVFAIDCEMSYTSEGPELTRVTVVSSDCQTVYETLVKPDNPILDYNTRFSGITEEDLLNVTTTIRDVQAVFLSKFSDKTIFIGHSFDSDLRALKIIHDTVIDTSVVFPHSRGPPYKKALRTLCGDILQKIIQNDVGGHDSAEDAIACMELMMWRIKQDLKQLK